MTTIGGLLLLLSLSTQALPAAPPLAPPAPEPPAAPVAEAAPPAPPVAEAAPPEPLPMPPPDWQPEVPKYGDIGTSQMSLIFGLGSGPDGFSWAGGGGYSYFVLPTLAPGAQVLLSGGTNLLTTASVLGTLRFVPVRTSAFALFGVGRAGRMLVSGHDDGWAAGGGGGVVIFAGPAFGVEIAYEYLFLFPKTFCDDLYSGCHQQGLSLGFVAGF